LRSLSPSIAQQEAQEPPIVQGKIPGVGLEEWGAVTQCLGEALPHYFGLTMFGNLDVFLCLTFFVGSLLCNLNKML